MGDSSESFRYIVTRKWLSTYCCFGNGDALSWRASVVNGEFSVVPATFPHYHVHVDVEVIWNLPNEIAPYEDLNQTVSGLVSLSLRCFFIVYDRRIWLALLHILAVFPGNVSRKDLLCRSDEVRSCKCRSISLWYSLSAWFRNVICRAYMLEGEMLKLSVFQLFTPFLKIILSC